MRVTYCKHCNRFFYSNRISNYCKICSGVLKDVPEKFDVIVKQTINERYRLAYKLTHNEKK